MKILLKNKYLISGIFQEYLKEELNQNELTSELNSLAQKTFQKPDISKLKVLYKFLDDNFYISPKRSPTGQTQLKNNWVKFVKRIEEQIKYSDMWDKVPKNSENESPSELVYLPSITMMFKEFDLTLIVQYFSKLTGKIKQAPTEIKIGANTYLNSAQLNEDKLKEYADAIELVFKELKGWRKSALDGGVTVDFAPATKFRSTTSGKYSKSEDILYVRATPVVLKRTKGTYGAFDYIIVHELGHRFENIKKVTKDFETNNSDRGYGKSWRTSRYSFSEGEAFAELFAIGNFDIKKDRYNEWDPEILEEFEKLMQAKDYK